MSSSLIPLESTAWNFTILFCSTFNSVFDANVASFVFKSELFARLKTSNLFHFCFKSLPLVILTNFLMFHLSTSAFKTTKSLFLLAKVGVSMPVASFHLC